MVEAGGGAGLGDKPLAFGRVLEQRGQQQLQRDRAFEGGVLRPVDDGKRAAPDFFIDVVAAQLAGGGIGHESVSFNGFYQRGRF